MDISELQRIYAGHPNTKGLAALLEDSSVRTIFLGGLHASAAALFVSSFLRENKQTFVFVLGDLEEAGYFYHDLTQVNGDEHILFFPSSYRRAVKYGQKDAANEILRTEVLSRLQKGDPLCVVTYPEALAEKVVSQEVLMDKTLNLVWVSMWTQSLSRKCWPVTDSSMWIMFMNRGNMLYAVVLLTSSLLLPSILTVLTFLVTR